MIALITATVGVISSLTALWFSLADRRRTIAQERRDEAEAARRAAAEKAAEQQKPQASAAREEMALAAPVHARVTETLAGPDPATAPATWLVRVFNDAPLPITDVRVIHTRGATSSAPEPFDLQSGSKRNIELPAAETAPRLAELAVEFTDAAGLPEHDRAERARQPGPLGDGHAARGPAGRPGPV
ncbi:hypothetical protein AB0F45_34910, partial [Streptomyces achromogenes]